MIIYKKNKGFTLVEILVVVAILSFLAVIVLSDFFSFKKKSDLNNNVQEFVSVLKLAQNKTLSSENYYKYGVYINTGVTPNQYSLFAGDSYATKISGSEKIYYLQDTLEFYGISLGGGNEIVFNKLNGAVEQSGSVVIRVKTDTSKNKTVYIAGSGAISLNAIGGSLDDSRVKDYRHLHIDYSRTINTASENIVLTFDNSVTQTIPINSYLVGGQIEWQGTTAVGGSNQIVRIITHNLNNGGTIFSVTRDGRNNKILKITLSGDASGYLAQYSADGLTANYTSTYVSSFDRQ